MKDKEIVYGELKTKLFLHRLCVVFEAVSQA